MSLSNNFPTIAPSLNLSFALTKALDPRITFTRTTTATYYGTQTAKAEENLLLYSQEFDNGYWTKTNATITANNVTAPDGTTTAETVTADAGTNIDVVVARFSLSGTSGADYAVSFFAKAGTYSALQITNVNFQASSGHANFDLSAGTVGTSANCTASIQNAGNSWYRCVVVFAATATVTNGAVYACLAASTSASRFQKWSPVGTETIELWGAQLEQRSAVSAYTPTTTQPITNYIPVLETAAAGEARFDHNPTTFESLGLLVEEQRTNLVLQSEDLGTTWNLGSGTLTANAWVPPSGSLTGDIFTVPADSTIPAQNVTVANSTSYTLSFYFNKSLTTAAFFRLRFAVASGSVSAFINVANLSFGAIQSGLASGEIINVGNGVYRAWVTMTYGASDAGARGIAISGTTTNNSSTPDTGKNIAIWGIQYEQGAFPTSYIPTTSATVTRNADAASMTGTNFSSWFNNAEGTVYIDYTEGGLPTYNLLALSDGTTANLYLIRRISALTLRTQGASNGTSLANLDNSNSQVFGQRLVRANAYKVGDNASVLNGGSPVTNTSTIPIPVVDRVNIGASYTATTQVGGCIRKLAYYPARLTNAQLQALTS